MEIPGKRLCFVVMRATEKQHVEPEDSVVSLDKIKTFTSGQGSERILAFSEGRKPGLIYPREGAVRADACNPSKEKLGQSSRR